MTIDDLLAQAEIRQVLYRYCRGIDRGDAAIVASVYHPDAIDDHGSFLGLGRDFPADVIPRMDRAGVVGQHHITNELMEIDGNKAKVESYFMALNPEGDKAAGTGKLLFVYGRYLDRFEKRDGVWLIAHRKVIIDYVDVEGGGRTWERAHVFTWGERRDADASAAFFTEE